MPTAQADPAGAASSALMMYSVGLLHVLRGRERRRHLPHVRLRAHTADDDAALASNVRKRVRRLTEGELSPARTVERDFPEIVGGRILAHTAARGAHDETGAVAKPRRTLRVVVAGHESRLAASEVRHHHFGTEGRAADLVDEEDPPAVW